MSDEMPEGGESGGEGTRSAHDVAAAELVSFVERHEKLEEDRKAVVAQQKEVMDEAKTRGYDVRALKKVIALRRMDRDDLAEHEALVDIYRDALKV